MVNGEWRRDAFDLKAAVVNSNVIDPKAVAVRNNLKDYFLTPAGEVPWQYEYVRFVGIEKDYEGDDEIE